jgi:prepilin-type N-terminal cleavage/methylation domain-containing protein
MKYCTFENLITSEKLSEKGFTLIELLVAILLFNIGFIAILSLQIQALAIIGDSKLKNQALMFASSSHEIHWLTQNNPKSAHNLSEAWSRHIHEYIPEISHQQQTLWNGDFSITLYWPASHGLTACQSAQQKGNDCLRL